MESITSTHFIIGLWNISRTKLSRIEKSRPIRSLLQLASSYTDTPTNIAYEYEYELCQLTIIITTLQNVTCYKVNRGRLLSEQQNEYCQQEKVRHAKEAGHILNITYITCFSKIKMGGHFHEMTGKCTSSVILYSQCSVFFFFSIALLTDQKL